MSTGWKRSRLPLLCGAAVAVCAAGAVTTPARAGTGAGTVGAPVTVGPFGNEPLIKVAPDGTLYIAALEYVYVSRDHGATWFRSPGTLFLNPEAQQQGVNLNTDTSIDVDPGGRFYLTFDYPYAGTTAVCTSDDRAQSFSCDNTALPGGTDRMWLTAPSNGAAFLTSNEGLYHTLFFTSGDRGQSWSLQKTTDSPLNPNDGPPVRSPVSPLVYQPFDNNASNQSATDDELSGPIQVHVWDPTSSSPTPAAELDTPLQAGAALDDLAMTPDGTIYLVSEDVSSTDSSGNPTGKDVQVVRSSDGGATWTKLPPLPGTATGTSAFSWIATGADGHVGVIYYRTPEGARADGVSAGAVWDVRWAETDNAEAAAPTWTTQTVDAAVHTGPICATTGCPGNGRFAGDFISAVFDAAGAPHLAWVDDVTSNGTTSTVVRYAGGGSGPGPSVPESPLALLLPAAALLGAGGFRLLRRRAAGGWRGRG